MSGFTRDEARAFIDAMRMSLEGKVGFKWYVEKLAGLSAYVESVVAENERMAAYLDDTNARADYETWDAAHRETDPEGES